MRRFTYTLMIALPLFAFSASVQFGAAMRRFMPQELGDARWASERLDDPTQSVFNVTLPPGQHAAVTVCGWFALEYDWARYLTTFAKYAPEAVQRSNPSLAFAAGGWPTNMTLSGTVTVDPFPFQPYAPGIASNYWPRGVYTIAGWSSNVVSVALGGASAVMFGPGPFNCNIVPGAGSACTVTGSGAAQVGVSRCPAAQFFTQIDGVQDVTNNLLTADSIVTNEWKFCAWRIRLNESEHIYRSDMAGIDRADCLGQTVTNAMPERVRAFDSRGIYTFGFAGLGGGYPGVEIHGFDLRRITRWLSDDELCRIHANGAAEMQRRGIPRWK